MTVEAVKEALERFFPRFRLEQQAWLGRRVADGGIPGATQDDILEALGMENELQGEFERRVRERVMRDVGPVLSIGRDESQLPKIRAKAGLPAGKPADLQRWALGKLFERERRYAGMRAVEMGRRLEKTVERVAVKRESRRGAFWVLGEAKEHTPECVALAGKFWAWEAIESVFRPPVGPGCKCGLKTEKAAVVQGLLMPGQSPHGKAAMERVRIVHGNHHGLREVREAIISTGLADEDVANAALMRWALEARA